MYYCLCFKRIWLPLCNLTGGMSLCTLPAPVSKTVLGLSPHINVVLFTTESHILLCRRSGQQVWSTRLPHTNGKPERVSSLSWSPDGSFFALIFEKGIYIIYDVNTGRPITQQLPKINSRVSSVVWAHANPDTSSAHSVSTIINGFVSLPDGISATNSLAAVGTQDGTLRISVYGALDIDELQVSPDSSSEIYLVTADEDKGEYVAVQDTKLHLFRSTMHASSQNSSSRDHSQQEILTQLGLKTSAEKSTTHSSALAILLSELLLQKCSKVQETLRSMAQTNSTFLEPFYSALSSAENKSTGELQEILKRELVNSVVFGVPSQSLRQWMETQHEQGFKRWYKNMSQNWESLHRLVAEDTMETLSKFSIVWGQLSGNVHLVEELHQLVYNMLSKLVPQRDVFENQAAYLEYLFREEIDRPITVTKISAVVLSEVGEMILTGGLLGDLDVKFGTDAVSLATQIQNQLNEKVAKIKSQLRNQLELVHTLDLGSRAVQLRNLEHSNYTQGTTNSHIAIILESGYLVIIDRNGSISRNTPIKGTNPVFTGKAEELISLDTSSRSLILPDGRYKELDFEPVAMVTREDVHHTVVCVLSEDCQHYQFLDLS